MYLIKDQKIRNIFRVTLMGLVIVDIILLSTQFFITVSGPFYEFILYFDLFVVILLIIQFVRQFQEADDKVQFLKLNWFDLIGMVPEIVIPGFATFLRYFRLIRILSLFRRNIANFFVFIEKTQLENGIITLLFVLISAASIFYFFEHGVNPHVNSIDDAMWYVLTTITTVGFGDIYPYTDGGRIATVIIIISGIGFVSYFIAKMSAWFFETTEIEEEKEELELETFEEQITSQLTSIQEDINEIKEKLDELEKK